MSISMQTVDAVSAPSTSQATGLLAWLSVVCGVSSVMLWLITGVPLPLVALIGVVAGWAARRRCAHRADRQLATTGAWINTACLAIVALALVTGLLFVSSFG